MVLKQCILTANDCYKKGTKMTGGKPTGIVVHSTGANNKNLKRYVQPLKSNPKYDAIIADLGKNQYCNDWNHSAKEMGRSVCVHAFIGVNAAGKVETYQTLPFDICCWGVDSGKNGSYNYNPTARVQFEMCEDGLSDPVYFNAVMKEAQEFCAYLCKKYGFGVDKISSHYESYLAGYGGNHGDPHNWLKPFGKTMDWFRSEVQKLLDAQTATPTQPDTGKVLYRVQTGAFAVRANADKLAAELKGEGFDTYIVQVDGLYKVQVGAYSVRANADAMAAKLTAAGYKNFITTKSGTAAGAIGSTTSATLSVGDKVKIQRSAPVYGKTSKFASWVYASTLYVREISGSRVVVSTAKTGDITGAVDKKYLTKI